MKSLREETLDGMKRWPIENVLGGIDYFEEGCLCILSGKLPVLIDKSAHELMLHYITGCVCSRHPEGELK